MTAVSSSVDLKSMASQRLIQLGLPTPADEDWKYLAFENFDSFKPASQKVSTYDVFSMIELSDYLVVIGQNGIDKSRSRLPVHGVFFGSDDDVTQDLKPLNDLLELNDALVIKAIAEMSVLLRVVVEEGVALDRPLHIMVDSSAFLTQQWVQPVVVLELESRASASIVLHPVQVSGAFVNALISVTVSDHASAELVVLNLDGRSIKLMSMSCRAVLSHYSQFRFLQASHHAGVSRSDVQVVFTGEHAASELSAVSVLEDHDQVHLRTHMTHLVGACLGRQLVKSILNGQSVSEFHGGVYVAKGADFTDSSQSNANLLLSDRARAISRPQLQIHADDVKAAHGATVGQLDDRHVFYLMSRGIPRMEVERFLLHAFILEALDCISMTRVKDVLKQRLMISGDVGE